MDVTSSTTNENLLWEEKNLTEPKSNCLNNSVNEQKNIINDTAIASTKNQCSDTGKISGIYKIINKVNGKYYVGSSKNIHVRWRVHKSNLNNNKHPNSHLQNAWNKYGNTLFEFTIVENTDKLDEIEQFHLNIAKKEVHNCYNVWFDVRCRESKVVSEETKTKISKSHILKYKNGYVAPMSGKTHSDLFKLNRSKLYLGANNPNFGNKKISGKLHFKYNSIKYRFYNKQMNITEIMTMYDFYNKYKLSQSGTSRLINKKVKSQMGWVII
jgi:group I intron endonuclease